MSRRPLPELVDRFRGLPVTVIGDAMLDGYLDGVAERVCREAPVPVVRVTHETYVPGGAANMAANLASMGAHVRFVSVVGDDMDARLLRSRLEDLGVDCAGVVCEARRQTIAKRRLVADGQLTARFDVGDEGPVSRRSERALGKSLEEALRAGGPLVVSDYGCGVLTDGVLATLLRLRSGILGPVVADSTRLAAYRAISPDVVKPSLAEALEQLALTPAPPDSRSDLAQALGDAMLDLSGARIVALTLDEDGAIVFEVGAHPLHTAARHHGTAHPAGAGDTYLGAFTLSLAVGASTAEAADVASEAAGVVVAKQGTSLCSNEGLRSALGAGSAKVRSIEQAFEDIARRRAVGQRIVFTNGCFDILHPGHIALLEHARRLGDMLVLGVNSDASVRDLKGEGRPVNRLEDRLRVLSALSFVDTLVPFEGPTAIPLIEVLRPDVFVKGGDYRIGEIPEASAVTSAGGRIEILPYFGSQSTSDIIARIRDASIERVS